MIKRISSFLLAALLLTGLCSCAKTTEPDPVVTDKPKDDIIQEEDDDLTPIYDNTAIIEAYRSNDTSALDEKQLSIYNAAIKAVKEFYGEEMNGEDIILAAHDWIVTHTTYDSNMLLPIPRQTEDSENPYGVLIKGQGICMGYTTTFQLFMDMLGIESTIVRGVGNDEEHAWNIVNLNGEWYHVDVTWDDFVPDDDDRPAFHIYFLVPDYAMEASGHVWEHETAPSATDDSRIYYKTHGLFSESEKENASNLISARDAGNKYAELATPSSDEVTNYMYMYWVSDLGQYAITIYWIN